MFRNKNKKFVKDLAIDTHISIAGVRYAVAGNNHNPYFPETRTLLLERIAKNGKTFHDGHATLTFPTFVKMTTLKKI